MASYRPSARALAAVAVLAAWGGSLTWLGLRQLEAGDNSEMALLASRRLAPGEARFAIYAGDVQIGSAGITLDTLSPGYRIVETTTLETAGDTGLVRSISWIETDLAPDLTLIESRARFVRAGQRHEGVARYGDRVLSLRTPGGVAGEAFVPGVDSAIPLVALPYRLALRGLGRGYGVDGTTISSWPSAARRVTGRIGDDSVAVFPDSAEFDVATLRWKAVHWDTTRVFDVEVVGPAGPLTLWIEPDGTVAGIEYPFGTRWVRTDFGLAVSDFRRVLAADPERIRRALPDLQPYALSAERSDSGTHERHFVVRRPSGRPIRHTAVAGLGSGRQITIGDTIRIRMKPFGSGATGAGDIVADPFSPRQVGAIYRLAIDAAAESAEGDRVEQVMRAIRRQVTLDTSYAAPVDAVGALRSRRARPDGIARLFVASMQSIDIPARYAVGFAPGGTGVRTHAWAEVWLPQEGGWVAVDPVLGRTRASTNLVRLAFAGSSHPRDLLAALADVHLAEIEMTEGQ